MQTTERAEAQRKIADYLDIQGWTHVQEVAGRIVSCLDPIDIRSYASGYPPDALVDYLAEHCGGRR